MKCFTVDESCVTQHIAITPSPYPHIGVGEEGRGREYTRFPVAQRFAQTLGENARVERASVLRTQEKGTLLLVEEKNHDDRRALVLANIAAGFRGSTEWTGANRTLVPCRYRGQYVPLGDTPQGKCTWCRIPVSDEDRMHPAAEGMEYKYDPFPPAGITVLAEGYCAQGQAGYMGGHAVRLLIMEPGACFRVKRRGRLYGEPAIRYVYWDGESLCLGTRDEIFPPSCETAEGEVI